MRIRIETKPHDGKAVTTRAISIRDLDTGAEMADTIRSMRVILEPDDIVRAEAMLYLTELGMDAVVEYLMQSPLDGQIKPVKRIEFADGTVWDAEIGGAT